MDKFVLKSKRTIDESAPEKNSKRKKTGKTYNIGPCNWETIGSILTMQNFDRTVVDTPVKIASFDMDSTLIETKSGKTFPTNVDDWKFWNTCVPEKLKELVDDNYEIVIFSNQSGLSKGKTNEKELKTKINNIAKQLGVPIQVFLMSEDDSMRKPRVGAWKFMISHCQIQVDMANSFYCGDAAGRPKAPGKTKKDFSCSDYKFAVNVGIPFFTPEKFFLDSKQSLHCNEKSFELTFDPRSLLSGAQDIDPSWNLSPSNTQEMIVLVGSPGSGKSTLYHSYFSDYGRINQDALKTAAKCKSVATEMLKEGKSIVIDNTNRDIKGRREWIGLANAHSIPVRAFYLDIPKPCVFHLNEFRMLQKELHPDRTEMKSNVPDMVIHGFFKNMEIPTKEEGFASVTTLPFLISPLLIEEDKALLTSFLLG